LDLFIDYGLLIGRIILTLVPGFNSSPIFDGLIILMEPFSLSIISFTSDNPNPLPSKPLWGILDALKNCLNISLLQFRDVIRQIWYHYCKN
jgi:hypothetical protein